MKTSQEYKDDPLGRFLNQESIEKAPERFTSNVMSRIQFETTAERVTLRKRKTDLVPVISIVITVLLIAVALLLPSNSNPSLAGPVNDLLNNISLHVSGIKLGSSIKINLPASMAYISIAVLMLTFFDRALNGIFHRNK
jgi:hypothetical protein